MSTIVACFGNVLRRDDGLGQAVAARLAALPLPEDVQVLDVGIGGIHLVQELLRGVDVLLVVDAVDLGRPPGTVIIQRPQVRDLTSLRVEERRDQLADMHLATPQKALEVAAALGVLPASTLVVGVQTTDTERVGQGLSTATADAVDLVVQEVRRLVAEHTPGPA